MLTYSIPDNTHTHPYCTAVPFRLANSEPISLLTHRARYYHCYYYDYNYCYCYYYFCYYYYYYQSSGLTDPEEVD